MDNNQLNIKLIISIAGFLLLGSLSLSANLELADHKKTVSREPIQPVPFDHYQAKDYDKIKLGRKLFLEKSLSATNSVSCASCHSLEHYGVDGKIVSTGIEDRLGTVNAPTVMNTRFNFKQFWDGRANNLEAQVDGPLTNTREMGSDWDTALAKLRAKPEYVEAFKKTFGTEITAEGVRESIAAFQKSLITPNAKFDRYLRGELDVLTAQEVQGYKNFKSFGCIACHQGVNIGGNMFQTMGVMGDYFKDRGGPTTEADYGRYNVTKDESDRFAFKVPSLRNVAMTAPYFHDGSAKTLEQAVKTMARYQLGKKLDQKDLDSIVAFLKTLTGEIPAHAQGDVHE